MIVKEAIHSVVMENLDGKAYNGEEVMDWTRAISEQIKVKLRGERSHSALSLST